MPERHLEAERERERERARRAEAEVNRKITYFGLLIYLNLESCYNAHCTLCELRPARGREASEERTVQVDSQ
jgi:hypothetical protein